MAAAGSYKQDLPPKGGYAPINYKRIPARQVLNGPLIYAGLFGSMAYGYWQYKRGIKVVHKQEIEMKSAGLALIPLTLAERDREFLKQLRRNRDAEEKLMADVEGWEVGTFYGHKVYKTLSEDEMPPICHDEFYVHTSQREGLKHRNAVRWLKMD